jgi:hypothetical protein
MQQARRIYLGVLVVVFVLSFVVGSASAQCAEEELFYVWCGYQCDYGGGGSWYCLNPNPDRCCYELVGEGRCGEGAIDYCPECQPGGCGF